MSKPLVFPPIPVKPKTLNRQQLKYLRDRVEKAKQAKRDAIPSRKKPPELRRAERALRRWENVQWAKEQKVRAKIQTAEAAVRQALLFLAPLEALAEVERFEKLKIS
jgi:hypothetical protein